MTNREKFKSSVGGRNVNIRLTRKLGSGKKAAFPDLEERLIAWIHDRDSKGLRVKEKFIMARAGAVREELLAEYSVIDTDDAKQRMKALKDFMVSTSWCNRFKGRHQLVSRRHTTSRMLPENFQEVARGFISEVQNFIQSHNIAASRIVNFDQVPRYFETENNSTIIKRGSKEVLLRKASTSHKRFTFTPVINAEGDILALHLLFTNLKKAPKVQPGCLVDVNKTGMWNDEILMKTIDHIVKKCQTPFREPVLVLLDSYGTHIKFVKLKEEAYARKNIFFKIIPAKMTGLLQPPDVAVNRGFQQSYNDSYNEHLANAINSDDPKDRTNAGNVKMPLPSKISEWVIEWAAAQTKESIAKAFKVCGLVEQSEFSVDALHKPLRECYVEHFSLVDWENGNLNDIDEGHSDEQEEDGECGLFDQSFSFFKAFYEVFGEKEVDYKNWLTAVIADVETFIAGQPDLITFFPDDDKKRFKAGKLTESMVEIYALAHLKTLNIRITSVDDK